MSEPSTDPGAHTPADDREHLATAGWAVPVAPGSVGALVAPTQAMPAASTPGPSAPERGTRAESTEHMGESQGTLPRLPPIPGYDVQQFVGRGGMGIVYQAIHLATGRCVALKLVNPSDTQDYVTRERFAREVRALAALKHPNIIPIYDAGDSWIPCTRVVVQWHAQPAPRTSSRPAAAPAVKLIASSAGCRGTVAGVLRDLKPLNILLSADDEPLVADFGWPDGRTMTPTSHSPGCRLVQAVHSAEQTLGRRGDYTPACDVWAIGVTLCGCSLVRGRST